MLAYLDEKFNKENDIKTGFKTNTILCVPILDQNDHPIGLWFHLKLIMKKFE